MTDEIPSRVVLDAQDVQEQPLPPLRRLLEDYLQMGAGKHNIHVLATYDVSAFTAYVAACKAQRRRPPSLVAYVARCLGMVLSRNPRSMAAIYRDWLLVPRHVNIAMTISSGAGGDSIPLLMTIQRVDEKPLPQIAREMNQQVRGVRRRAAGGTQGYRWALWFALRPAWLRRIIYRLARLAPPVQRGIATHFSYVAITSITQYSQGRGGWGLPLLAYSLGITLGGMSPRAIVVDGQVVARDCLDVTLTLDHVITDGAPATTLAAQLAEEIESGRLLAEFDAAPNNKSE